MKKILIACILLISISSYSQKIYGDFFEDMTKKEAKKILRDNYEKYNDINFGNNVSWLIMPCHLECINKKLKYIVFKGNAFLPDHDTCQKYLKHSVNVL